MSPDLEPGTNTLLKGVVADLKTLPKQLRAAKGIKINELKVGQPARAQVVTRAQAADVPEELIVLGTLMDGLVLSWANGKGPAKVEGRVQIPSLLQHAAGTQHGITLDSELEDYADTVFVLDADPRPRLVCWVGGDHGIWDFDNDVFDAEGVDVVSYLKAGIANLFVDGWFEHVLEHGFDSVHPKAAEVRKAIGR